MQPYLRSFEVAEKHQRETVDSAIRFGTWIILRTFTLIALCFFLSYGCKPDSTNSTSIDGAQNPPFNVFVDSLGSGLGLGLNTSLGRTDWHRAGNGIIRMAYPSGQAWGAVFVTVGQARNPPRPSIDMSKYDTLSVDLRGHYGGESVRIGIKDNTDPDDGRETKITIPNLTTQWKTVRLALSEFHTADLSRVYVLIEFVFEPPLTRDTVYFRRVQYLQ